MKMKRDFNTMRSKRVVPNLSKGQDIGKGQPGKNSKGGAGKSLGPRIGVGYLVSGKGNARGTGGRFSKVPPLSGNVIRSAGDE